MTKKEIRDNSELFAKLDAADKAQGLPVGTMRAIMHNEISNSSKFIDAPDTYHYPVAADGKHRTKDGTQSSAFGPFGILDSTAKKPGYGITPLKDKSLDEQIRFSSEMLGKVSKKLGGLEPALNLYGGGTPGYTQKILAKVANPDQMHTPAEPIQAKAQIKEIPPVVATPPAPAVKEVIQQPVVAQVPIQAPTDVVVAAPVKEAPVVPVNPMAPLQVAEPITPEALQYAQPKEQPANANIMEALASFGEEGPQANVAPIQQLAQMKQLKAVADMRALQRAAQIGAGLEDSSSPTQVVGTNDQVRQIKSENSPMALFNQIRAQQQAEAMNYG